MPDLFASTDPHTVFLHPGEFYFGGGPTRIATLLGSCVSITVWHPRLLVGGMCHYMLPNRQRPPQAALCGRYGDEAMEWLLARIRDTGAPAAQFQAMSILRRPMSITPPMAVSNILLPPNSLA
jgi:chemotaxis protein CheD